MENCLRISIGKPEENRIFIETLKEILKEGWCPLYLCWNRFSCFLNF
jgi:hypothetical protein